MVDKIEFIEMIKKFGEERLHLKFDGSFEKFSDKDFSCNWVYATAKTKLKSIFDFPFEFYSDESKAKERISELRTDNYDTYFYHAEAHGGRNCPITKELLNVSKARQSYVILHEAYHSTCRLNDYNLQYAFEESSGRVVGLFGAIEFAQSIGDEAFYQAAIQQEKAWEMFAQFINAIWMETSAVLLDFPSQNHIEKMKKDIRNRADSLSKKMFDSWEKKELQKDINNAFLIRYRDYTIFYQKTKEIYLKENNVASAVKRYGEILNFKKEKK